MQNVGKTKIIIVKNQLVLIFFFLVFSPPLISQVLVNKNGATVYNKGSLSFKGDWRNNGNFIDTTGTVILSGSIQQIGGSIPIAFNNLTIEATSTATVLTAGHTIRTVLLADGTLNADGNLTLLSSVFQTALIDGSGVGEVSGDVIMQRYLPSGFGYKYISSPFQSAAVGQIADDIDLTATFPTFYQYDENRVSSGWVNYTAITNILDPLNGYAANFGDVNQPDTFDITGEVNNGPLQLSVENNDQLYTTGFNLVGNPYPSPIDWNAPGWTKTNIDNALYFFKAGNTDQYLGTYSTYINGVSSDGIANNIIPSMQGFFIHVSDGSFPVIGSLGLTNNARINDLTHTFFKSSDINNRSLIRISAGFADQESLIDPAVIYFSDSASSAFDNQLDALKLMNTDLLVPSLYAFLSNKARLSIDAIPFSGDEIQVIPLGIKLEKPGEINFKMNTIEQIPEGLKVYFFDALTGINQDLTLLPEYKIYLAAGQFENRFFIKFSYGELVNELPAGDNFSVYTSDEILFVKINYLINNEGNLLISNMLGQMIWQQEINSTGIYEFHPNAGSGIYLVSLIAGNQVSTKKVFIK